MDHFFLLLFMLIAHVTSSYAVSNPDCSVTGRCSSPGQRYKVVCYYVNWSQYRLGDGKYTARDIDPDLCTHILYAFAKIQGNDLGIYEYNDVTMYGQVQDLKNVNPELKILLSVGGATSSQAFRTVASGANSRTTFAKNVVKYVRKYNFDGVDLDWEFPSAQDRTSFTELIKEIRHQVENEAALTGRPPLLVTCALGASSYAINQGYDLDNLHQYLDFATVMTYDLHGGWDSVTGFNAALFGYTDSDVFNQKWVMERYLTSRFPSSKLLLGIPTYGRTFTLCNPTYHGVRDCSKGYGLAGPYTRSAGILAYNEICQKLASGWTKAFDVTQRNPYAYHGDQWVGFDDSKSVKAKVDYVMEKSLGGVMFWDLSMDDFRGRCNEGKYPLISVASSLLSQLSPTRTTTTRTTTRTTTTPTTTRTTTTPTTTRTTTTPTTTRTTTKPTTTRTTTTPTTTRTTTTPTTTRTTTTPTTTRTTTTLATTRTTTTPTTTRTTPRTTTVPTTTRRSTTQRTMTSSTTSKAPFTTTPAYGLVVTSSGTPVVCTRLFSFVRHPTDCSSFYRCVWGQPVLFRCPAGTHFSMERLGCVWSYDGRRKC